MSFSINSDNDEFFDAETFSGCIEQSRGDATEEIMDSVRLGNRISFNPVVEAKSINGSTSHFPIAAYDGYHNCRQYFHEPYPDGDPSEVSLSLNGALEAREGSMSWSSGNLTASPKLRKGPADAGAENVAQGPALCARMGGGTSFNPTVEAKSVNGSFSHFPIAAHDGYHNYRQYFKEPGGWDGDSSEVSLSLNGALEAREGSMSWSSGDLSASPNGADNNMMKGPALFAGLTAAVHHLTSYFDDDVLEEEEEEDGVSTRISQVQREPVVDEDGTAEVKPRQPREVQCTDEKNITQKNRTVRKHSTESAETRAAK